MTSEANLTTQNNAYIKEIFVSIQGEGPYIGYNQLFIRFADCNLNCKYCDTDFSTNFKEYSSSELLNEIKKYGNYHSVSLTGGEPLMFADFLAEFLPLTGKKIYLETNATLCAELERTIDFVDVISADIKLNSSSANGDLFKIHDRFFEIAKKYDKEIFAKVVFNSEITEEEIKSVCSLAEKYNICVILQPQMNGNNFALKTEEIEKTYEKFVDKYDNVRLIPQTHKFLNVR